MPRPTLGAKRKYMEEKKRKNTWVDAVSIVLVVVLGQTVSEAVPVESEMLKFLVAALMAGILLVLFYLVRFWLFHRK